MFVKMRFFTVPVYYDMEWRKRQEGFAAEWFMQHFAVKTEADINLPWKTVSFSLSAILSTSSTRIKLY